jgi:hypothetical protein
VVYESRLREAMRSGDLTPMGGGGGGIVEIEETVYGRAATRPEGRAKGRGFTGSMHKNIVLSLVRRGGEVRSFHVSGSTIAELVPVINANLAAEAALMTDMASWYKNMNEPTDDDGARPFAS